MYVCISLVPIIQRILIWGLMSMPIPGIYSVRSKNINKLYQKIRRQYSCMSVLDKLLIRLKLVY